MQLTRCTITAAPARVVGVFEHQRQKVERRGTIRRCWGHTKTHRGESTQIVVVHGVGRPPRAQPGQLLIDPHALTGQRGGRLGLQRGAEGPDGVADDRPCQQPLIGVVGMGRANRSCSRTRCTITAAPAGALLVSLSTNAKK